jgi:hypothetical protein
VEPAQFEITGQTRDTVVRWPHFVTAAFSFPAAFVPGVPIRTRQYGRLTSRWISAFSLDPASYRMHSLGARRLASCQRNWAEAATSPRWRQLRCVRQGYFSMSKCWFTNAECYAVFTVHRERWRLCRAPKQEVDDNHPRVARRATPATVPRELGRRDDFRVNSFENRMPAHPPSCCVEIAL